MRLFKMSIAAVAVLIATTSAVQAGEWESLFDGKTLKGWEQLNGTAKYTVEDGTIVGRTEKGSPNSFLCSKQKFDDFELEFDVKCDTGLNSGVQIRSAQKSAAQAKKEGAKGDKGEGRVFGPQVEIESSPGQAGYIYGEATGRGWLSKEPGEGAAHSHFKNDEWNHYRVIAKGAHFQTFINGTFVADLTDGDILKTHPKGFIGLQVHGIGNKTETYKVAWKNIKIKTLK